MKRVASETSANRSGALRVSSSPASLVPSGFGTVMEFERTLHFSTDESRRHASGPRADLIGRTLQDQSHRLTGVMALLERRCALLPHPTRFQALVQRHRRLPASGAVETIAASAPDELSALLEQHRGLLERLRRLIRPHLAGDRGEAMLAEVVRNHAQMVWRLNTLLEEEARSEDAPRPAGGRSPG